TGGTPDRRTVAERCAVMFGEANMGVRVRDGAEEIYRNAAAGAQDAPAGATEIPLASPQGGFTLVIEVPEPAEAAPPARAALPSRFSFVLDADGRFVDVGPALAVAVG